MASQFLDDRRGGTDLDSLADFDARVSAEGSIAGCYLSSLDLRERSHELARIEVDRAVFLGCIFAPEVEAALERRGALIFPNLPDLPFNPYRSGLYSAAELYSGLEQGYRYTLDARNYRWWRHVGQQRSLTSELAMTLHDHAISEALGEVDLTAAVGVMGGHRLQRGTSGYADAARLGRSLVQAGYPVITGGGPGAMEAANLGAGLDGNQSDLEQALSFLGAHPGFSEDIASWAEAGLRVRERWDCSGASYAVPTWLYGHEPPNVFNSGIAKFFSNAIREDVLLRHSTGALVCLPGAAGTVQEIFQAVTPRFYADQPQAPLILVGVEYWTRTYPVWELLVQLAQGRPMATALHLVDSPAEVPRLLG